MSATALPLCLILLTACAAPRLEVRARATRQSRRAAATQQARRWGVSVVAALSWTLHVSTVANAEPRAPGSVPPAVQQLVSAALRAQARGGLQRADRLYRRARLSGLVPRLRVSARRGQQQDLSATTTLAQDRTDRSTDDELTLDASLTFEFDRLVFAPEQVRLLRLRRGFEADRRALVERVVRLYFEYQRKKLERDSAAQPDLELELGLAELAALLDAYTEGAFTGRPSNVRRR